MSVRGYGGTNKNSSEMYSTLPHLRTTDGSRGGGGGGGSGSVAAIGGNIGSTTNCTYHYDNKNYERFEPLMSAVQHAKYDKQKYDQISNDNNTASNNVNVSSAGTSGGLNVTTFGHKRSPSGESIGRNINLAGAKLVLPAGEIPTLKPIDKNLLRPKLPPPGPPPPSSNSNNNSSGKL